MAHGDHIDTSEKDSFAKMKPVYGSPKELAQQKKAKMARKMRVGNDIHKKVRVGDEITGPGHPNWSKGRRYDAAHYGKMTDFNHEQRGYMK